jgi:parvulin-like peptidyl-prolyl isomerase
MNQSTKMAKNEINFWVRSRKAILLLIAITAGCLANSAASPAAGQAAVGQSSKDATPRRPSSIAARVNGVPIHQSDIDRAVAELARNQNVDPSVLPALQANALQQMVDRALLNKLLSDPKMSPSKEELDAAVDEWRGKFKQQGVNFEEYLTKNHQSEAGFRAGLAQQLAWSKFVRNNASDENLQKLFDQFHERFDGTERRVSHILLRPDGPTDPAKLKALAEQASKLRDQINAGTITFDAAAEKYSAGPSRHNGGDLGFIPPQGVMVEQFSDAAFTMKPGEISPPVLTPFGIHLIKVTDVKPGKKTMQDVHDALMQPFSQVLLANVTKQLRDSFKIEYSAGVPHFKPGTTDVTTEAETTAPPTPKAEPTRLNPEAEK